MDDSYANGDMQQPEGQEQGGYCIEIYVGADGKPQSVNVEQKGPEDVEEGMPPAPPMLEGEPPHEGGKGVPVTSMEEAMSIVQQIVQNQGSMPEDQGSPEDQMMQGYGKGGVGAKRGGLPVRKVFSGGM